MTRAEAKAKEMGVTMNEVYDFIKNHKEAKKDCNDLLASGMDFDEASVLAYSSWRESYGESKSTGSEAVI